MSASDIRVGDRFLVEVIVTEITMGAAACRAVAGSPSAKDATAVVFWQSELLAAKRLPRPIKADDDVTTSLGHAAKVLAVRDGLAWIAYRGGRYSTENVDHLTLADGETQ